jgi:hypothetical protein
MSVHQDFDQIATDAQLPITNTDLYSDHGILANDKNIGEGSGD